MRKNKGVSYRKRDIISFRSKIPTPDRYITANREPSLTSTSRTSRARIGYNFHPPASSTTS